MFGIDPLPRPRLSPPRAQSQQTRPRNASKQVGLSSSVFSTPTQCMLSLAPPTQLPARTARGSTSPLDAPSRFEEWQQIGCSSWLCGLLQGAIMAMPARVDLSESILWYSGDIPPYLPVTLASMNWSVLIFWWNYGYLKYLLCCILPGRNSSTVIAPVLRVDKRAAAIRWQPSQCISNHPGKLDRHLEGTFIIIIDNLLMRWNRKDLEERSGDSRHQAGYHDSANEAWCLRPPVARYNTGDRVSNRLPTSQMMLSQLERITSDRSDPPSQSLNPV